jgi:hypothetical protein
MITVLRVLYITSLLDISASDVVLVDRQLPSHISMFLFCSFFRFISLSISAYFNMASDLHFPHYGIMREHKV